MRRLDYLRECNDQQVPVEDFRLAFCVRCVQPECTRSAHGTTKFDQRVATWEERLFSKVPRMDPTDPRIREIQAKQFKMFNPPVQAIGTPSAWLDPRDLAEPDPVPQDSEPPPAVEEEEPIPETEPAPVPIPEEPLKVPESPEPAPQPVAASTKPMVKATTTKLSPDLLQMNTPKQSGRMLPGKPATAPKDPWAAPEPPRKTEQGVVVVKRGATVRLGGNGVE